MIKIGIGKIEIGADERRAIKSVLDSGRISECRKVREFEVEWSRFVGTQYCVASSSGSSALIMGLLALLADKRYSNIKKGKKIITSPVTYAATSNAIVLSGLHPVYVDIDPTTFTLQVDQIEDLLKKSGNQYSIILPVHLMGYMNDMTAINALADRYGLVTFEDAAQAHGSVQNGKLAGSHSLLADFSFYIAHNIQVGEMGAVVTDDRQIEKLLRQIKANGRMCSCPVCVRMEGKCPYRNKSFDPRFRHEYIGYNFKTMEFQAAFASSQLKKIHWIIRKRQSNVKYLNRKLEKYADVLQLPLYSDDVSYLAYPIITKKPRKYSRHKFMIELEQRGVEVRPLFGCIPLHQPAYKHMKQQYAARLPNADKAGRHGFYIGCHQYLKKKDLDYIVESFEYIFKGH
jgi:CDP-6-deoxy-D-xylo-4-hexulose-3-dehydrase